MVTVALTKQNPRTIELLPEVTYLSVSMPAFIVTTVVAIRRLVIGAYLELGHSPNNLTGCWVSQNAGSESIAVGAD